MENLLEKAKLAELQIEEELCILKKFKEIGLFKEILTIPTTLESGEIYLQCMDACQLSAFEKQFWYDESFRDTYKGYSFYSSDEKVEVGGGQVISSRSKTVKSGENVVYRRHLSKFSSQSLVDVRTYVLVHLLE